MAGYGFAVDRQSKYLRNSESAANAKARAARGQVVYGAGNLLTGGAVFYDPASGRRTPFVSSTLEHCETYCGPWAGTGALPASTAAKLGNIYVRVRLQV